MKIARSILIGTRMVLLGLCIYATTDLSVNPKQKETKHSYSDCQYFYFTNISLYCTIFTSCLCLVSMATGYLKRAANLTLSIFPVFNFITVVVFWSLYFIKRSLIINKDHLRPGYETYLLSELALHLFPFILTGLEQLDKHLTKKRRHYYYLLGCVVGYCVLVHAAYFYKKTFIYPFLNAMSYVARAMFFVAMYLCGVVFYNVNMFINHKLCSSKVIDIFNK